MNVWLFNVRIFIHDLCQAGSTATTTCSLVLHLLHQSGISACAQQENVEIILKRDIVPRQPVSL